MIFNNPLSPTKAEQLISLLDLTPGTRVLDAGCGQGEFLIRTIEATGADGLGLDREAKLIAKAQAAAAERVPSASCEFRQVDLRLEALDGHAFDAAVCLGSTHAFADGDAAYPGALEQLTRAVSPGGRLLLGEGYWKQPPAPEYLELLGEPVGIYHDHAGNIAVAEAGGLVPLYATVSNDDEWDHFEWSHRMRVENDAAQAPDDQALQEKLQHSRQWRDGYLRWGRSTMGFGFYLLRKPQ